VLRTMDFDSVIGSLRRHRKRLRLRLSDSAVCGVCERVNECVSDCERVCCISVCECMSERLSE